MSVVYRPNHENRVPVQTQLNMLCRYSDQYFTTKRARAIKWSQGGNLNLLKQLQKPESKLICRNQKVRNEQYEQKQYSWVFPERARGSYSCDKSIGTLSPCSLLWLWTHSCWWWSPANESSKTLCEFYIKCSPFQASSFLGILWSTWSIVWFFFSNYHTCVITSSIFPFPFHVTNMMAMACLCGIHLVLYIILSFGFVGLLLATLLLYSLFLPNPEWSFVDNVINESESV